MESRNRRFHWTLIPLWHMFAACQGRVKGPWVALAFLKCAESVQSSKWEYWLDHHIHLCLHSACGTAFAREWHWSLPLLLSVLQAWCVLTSFILRSFFPSTLPPYFLPFFFPSLYFFLHLPKLMAYSWFCTQDYSWQCLGTMWGARDRIWLCVRQVH